MITLQTGKSVVNQIVGIPDKEDRIIWLQVNTHALGLGTGGKPVAVVISFADVSGLKQIESELRESERHLQSISRQFEGVLEAIPDRILILDREMRVVWLNWPEELLDPDQRPVPQDVRCYQLPGVNCGPVADKTSPLCDDCPVKKTFESGRTEIVQKDLSDGRIMSLRTFPVFSEEGVVVNVIEIAQDITASLLQQTQAARAGQLAALGELAAGVAHEINNPINGVINYAQLILNKAAADSREQELSQRIINESERIATIIRELLYFAREESHEVDCITVMHAINEALALVQHQLYKDGIDLQLEFLDDLPMVQSSSHQIPRLFLNLITNARHALNEKYPADDPNKVLLVRGQTLQKEQGQFVQVSVKDYGVGIPEELLSRVMNPFVTTKTSTEGTGLGLSISHEIVQKHGGTLSIDSVHNEYTEVIVELPVIE
jgi:signal transduction histidine kinase